MVAENHSSNGDLEPTSVPQKSESLRKVLRQHTGERHLVIIQDFPDPDALSSAWAYALIAQQFEIDCDIVYGGTLSHQENIALVKLTNLPVQRWTSEAAKKQDLSSYAGCVFLDSQGTTSQLTGVVLEAKVPVIVLIDHHSLQQQEFKPEFVDIRPQIKATATILVQYIQAGLVEFDSNNTTHVNCATALMHGLRSDTNQLRQAGREEFLAAAYLSQFYDSGLLDAVLRSSRSKRVMDVIERALSNRKIQDNVSISGVGYLRANDRDAIPQAADFLLTEENVHTAVVYGIVYDDFNEVEIVTGSLRTNKITLDPDEFIKEAFGTDATGKFFGGGRSQAGGFEIPLGFLSGFSENKEYSEMKWRVYDTQVKQKLVRLVNPN
ncbi:MAG: bifunctional oligoribonuclease/PAP phosphatase NrnA [Microcoleaceae cyanobacterium]